MKTKMSLLILVSLCLIISSVAVSQLYAWGKKETKKEFHYEFLSGWRVVNILPADETKQVSNYKSMKSRCAGCVEEGFKNGNFLFFHEISKVDFEGWWTIIVDIPPDYFLNIPKQASIIMKTVDTQGDTLRFNSTRIVFCKGWTPDLGGKRCLQHTVLDNSSSGIQVKPYRDIGSEEFQNGEVDGVKYIVGYIYFGEIPECQKVVGFLFPRNIDAYPVNNRVTRR
ncbi:MAG: hypothetical protein ABIH38_02325 [Patescibacteria group bacterium]